MNARMSEGTEEIMHWSERFEDGDDQPSRARYFQLISFPFQFSCVVWTRKSFSCTSSLGDRFSRATITTKRNETMRNRKILNNKTKSTGKNWRKFSFNEMIVCVLIVFFRLHIFGAVKSIFPVKNMSMIFAYSVPTHTSIWALADSSPSNCNNELIETKGMPLRWLSSNFN